MTVASGTSTPTSITVGRDQHLELARGGTAAITSSFGGRFIWPCSRPTASPPSSPGRQARALLGGRSRLDPLGSLDQRADDVGPVACGDLVADPLPCQVPIGVGPASQVVVTGHRPGGISSRTVRSRSPKITMAAVRGIGVAVMTSRSGSAPR